MKPIGYLVGILALSLIGCSDHNDNPPPASPPAPAFVIKEGASLATAPDDATNEVVAIDNSTTFGVIERDVLLDSLAPLDGRLSVSYFFEAPKTCDGGSPRVVLAVDADADGLFDEDAPVAPDGWAYGRLADDGTCPAGSWETVDLTDATGRWSLGAFGGGAFETWDAMVALLEADHPGYRIVEVELVEDTGTTPGVSPGVTYYDDVTFGDRTLSNHADVITTP